MDIADFPTTLGAVSIITGRGDNGETDLLFGRRISKSALRIEVLGSIDELNAALGMARANASEPDWIAIIDTIQEKLIGLMGQMATLPEDRDRYLKAGFPLIAGEDVGGTKPRTMRLQISDGTVTVSSGGEVNEL